MTIDGRDDDPRPTVTADGGPGDADSQHDPAPAGDETASFAALFERAPTEVSLDAVARTLRAIRAGESE
jgi:hypothetical protein